MGPPHIWACSLALLFKFRGQLHLFGKLIAEHLGEASILILVRVNLPPVVAPLALLSIRVDLEGNSAANQIASPVLLFVKHIVPLGIAIG